AHVGRNIQRASGGNDGAGLKRELDCAINPPAGKLDGPWVGVCDLNIFLGLVARGRIVIDAHNLDRRTGWLRQGNAGVLIFADAYRERGIGDTVLAIEMIAAQVKELLQQIAHAHNYIGLGRYVGLSADWRKTT